MPIKEKIINLLTKIGGRGHFSPDGVDVGHWVPVLCYHRVLPGLESEARRVNCITPERFEAQMALLAAHGFQSLSLEEFGEMARGQNPVGPRCVLVTFDDGYADIYRYSWPIARQYKIKLNLFILTKYTGGTDTVVLCRNNDNVMVHIRRFPELWRQLTWEEIRTMRNAGVGIGLHGHSHQRLIDMPSPNLRREIESALEIFKDQLEALPTTFAIPFGSAKTFCSRDIQLLKSYGMEMIFSSIKHRNFLPCRHPFFYRVVVHNNDNMDTFKDKLLGGHDFLGTIRYAEHQIWEFTRRVFNRYISSEDC